MPITRPPLRTVIRALLPGLVLGAAVLMLAWGPPARLRPAAPPVIAVADLPSRAGDASARQAGHLPQRPRLPQFGRESASADARQIAHWVFQSGDHGDRAVVLVDKRDARVYVFDRDGQLQGAAPALLGSALGDHTVPGVGDKPIAQVLPAERTTPAGRFVAELGTNASGEEVVWVDYGAAVSMHRVRATVKAERRLERLASSTPLDNRISYGCINLPVPFYETVLSPLVRGTGAVVYVLPETQAAAQWFGADAPPAVAALAHHEGRPRPTSPAGGG